MEVPKDIVDGLSNCHLSFLVPKQDLVHLFSPRGIQLVPVETHKKDVTHKFNQMRSVLNQPVEELQEVTEMLLSDFDEELPEIHGLTFKKPAMKYNKHGTLQNVYNELGSLEQLILTKVGDVARSNVVKPDIKMKRIRLNCQMQKEYEFKVKSKHLQKHKLHQQQNEEQEIAPMLKKQRKSSYLAVNELEGKAAIELISLIEQIGLTDDDLDINALEHWFPLQEGEDFEGILSNDTLNNIHDYLIRLNDSDLLNHEIKIEHLIRIQALCSKSIRKFAGSNFQDIVNLDHKELPRLYNVTTNAASASIIIMQLFLSKRLEKQLYLETYLNPVVEFIFSVLEDGILPLSKKIINDSKIDLKKYFIILLQMVKQLLSQLMQYLQSNNLDEGLVTKLEYLSSMIIFTEINIKEKTSVIGLNSFEDLRNSCSDLICLIFSKWQDQRQFILNEILTNIDKLPTNKNHARQFKLLRGVNVQLVSVLLVRLIHTFNLDNFQQSDSAERNLKLLSSNSEDLKKTERDELKLIQENFATSSSDRISELAEASSQISSALLNKFVKSVDTTSKHVFEILLEDLLNLVAFPEWAGAEVLLVSFMKTLMYIFETDSYSAPAQTFALEMIGSIGCKILQLKNQKETVNLTYNMSIFDFIGLTKDYINCFVFLQTKQKSQDSMNFLLLKLLQSTNELMFQCKPQADSLPSRLFALVSDFQKLIMLSAIQGKIKIEAGQAIDSNLESLSITSYNNILLSQELLHLYDNFLNLVMKSLDHNKIKSRTRAIKNLSSLVAKEPSLLTLKSVSSSIILRMNDSSLQVRDAVIELIGQFLCLKPALIDDYYQIICQKMDDPSIAVRKRVMKLAKELYNLNNKDHVRSLIAEKLLRRLEDEEDTIIELARSTLLEFWFLSMVEEINTTNSRATTMNRIDVILHLIGKNEKNWEYFTMFLTDHVLFVHDDDPPQLHDTVMIALKIIIDKTLDFIIECVDNTKLKKKVEKAMGLLSVITKAEGKLISQDQLICLKPYLTDESSTGDTVCYYTLSIFRNALPEATILKPSFVKDSQISLLKRLTKFNVKELGEAMPCAWILSSLRNDTTRMATAALSCLKLAKPFLDKANKGELNGFDPKLLRLLFLIGNFGKFCDFTSDKQLFVKASIGLSENELVVSVFVKFLLCFANESLNHQIRRASIKNLIYVCSSHPKLLMTDPLLRIMDQEFASDNTDIKAAIIQEFIEFLEQEEALNLVRTSKKTAKDSKGSKLDVSVFHGNSSTFITDGICASLVQRYMEPVLQMTLLENGGYSTLATRYLQLIVKLGFANPKLCMPTIIALESSPVFALRSRALSMHHDLFEKHESLIESSYVEGVKVAFNYRKRLSPNHLNENNFIKTFYQVVGESRNARKKFLVSLMRSFSFDIGDKDKTKLILHKEYVIFVIHNLLVAGISILEEAYLIVNSLDKAISADGVNLSLQIASFIERDLQEVNKWELACLKSQVFIVFLRFRSYLFQVYNLNEDKARDFHPNKVDRELRNAPKVIRDSALKLNDLLASNKEDFELISHQFMELINDVQEVV